MKDSSKPIARSDDAAKDFLRLTLGESHTRGFDVDSIYCEIKNNKVRWTLFEFLKCVTVLPENSHPNRYWKGTTSNRRKFLSLWSLCLSLQKPDIEARLFLVNYRDETSKVKVMEVINMTEDAIETKDWVGSFDEWRELFQGFNDNKEGSTWDALKLVR